jgi:hypothetical protein
MGRFREALADVSESVKKVTGKPAPDHHQALMRHALGLAHHLNKLKKSGQFKRAAR